MHRAEHAAFWFEDGSVILRKAGTLFKVHRSIIELLSPEFFEAGGIVEIDTDESGKHGSISTYDVTSSSISIEDLGCIFAHLYHRIHLSTDAPFDHVLRLFVSTSPGSANMPSVHTLSARYLEEKLDKNPLTIDFSNIGVIQAASDCAAPGNLSELQASLGKTLYYAYMISDTVIYPDQEIPVASTTEINQHRLTQTEAHIIKHLMTRITDFFSPTIFQPVNGSHMACTDIFAKQWVPLAVEPALEDGGLCDTFRTLNRLIALDWVDEVYGDGGGGAEGTSEDAGEGKEVVRVCDECLKSVREEWAEEAMNIWAKIGEWIEEARQLSREIPSS